MINYSKGGMDELLKRIANGNEAAYKYLVIMCGVFRVWDDTYDQDKPIDKDKANAAFANLTFDLQKNSFYRQFQEILAAVTFVSWNAWMDSNAWRGNPDRMKGLCAWFIRDYVNEIAMVVAWLTGGVDHVRSISEEYRAYNLKLLVEGGMDGFLPKE